MADDLSFFARTNLPDCNGRPTCTPPPVCPACGGLECLCRPRFFAGQLLTEEDLNRLDHYVVAKNRLHNRYLVGWGVACGLEVVCNVCGPNQASGGVLVKPGYALSPCGNDIVLCKAEPVDVCALINACRPPQDDCYDLFTPAQPPAGTPGAVAGGVTPSECDGGSDDWVLAVCYSEKPARGVTALLRAASPAANCKCGGNCGCGGQCTCGGTGTSYGKTSATDCGCGNGKPPAPNPNVASALPEQCEPTLVCEGYRFVAYKAPTTDPQQRQYGAAAKRFLCCILPLFQDLGSSASGGQKTPQQAIDWVYSLRDAVRDFIVNEGFYDCRIAARLNAVAIPSFTGAGQGDQLYGQLNVSAYGVLGVGLLVLQKCLCAALLPPCPDPSQLDCVPLATVTVTRGQCRVLRVCNLSARKFLVTIPNIEYWLSFFTLFTGGKSGIDSFRRLLETLCCTPLEGRYAGDANAVAELDLFRFKQAPAPAQPAKATAKKAAPAVEAGPLAAQDGHALGNLLWSAVANADRKVNVENLVLAALGARDADGKPFASAEELANPSEFLMLNQLVAPVLRQLAPAGALGGVTGMAAAAPPDAGRADELAREIAELRGMVARQDKTIAALKKRVG